MSGVGHFFHKVFREVTRPFRQVVGGVGTVVGALAGRLGQPIYTPPPTPAIQAPTPTPPPTPAVAAPTATTETSAVTTPTIIQNTTRERRRGKQSLMIDMQGINSGGSGGGLNV